MVQAALTFSSFCNRFIPPAIAKKYDFEVPEYSGIDQVVEVGASGQKL
jgi:NAD(P)H-hydrate epimerase